MTFVAFIWRVAAAVLLLSGCYSCCDTFRVSNQASGGQLFILAALCLVISYLHQPTRRRERDNINDLIGG